MSQSRNQVLVVKVGTSTLIDDKGRLDRSFIIDLATQLSNQLQAGWDVALVTSGAIRAGREQLELRNLPHPPSSGTAGEDLPFKQAAAAIGQGRLMHTYTEAFAWRNIDCAQVLLTREDLDDPRRSENARNTLFTLFDLGIIPIINENDTVAVEEIKFGDNDNLAALVARLVEADMLLILSDVEGLYPSGWDGDPTSEPLRIVECIDESILGIAGDTNGAVGTGGMKTKVEAARTATLAGIRTVIARGRRHSVVRDATSGDGTGTTFLPAKHAQTLPR